MRFKDNSTRHILFAFLKILCMVDVEIMTIYSNELEVEFEFVSDLSI